MSSWEEEFKNAALAARFDPKIDRFFFLRHGETDHNKQNLLQGWTDIPLNELGIEQARKAADALCQQPITRIVSSPLKRARRTAELIAELSGHPEITFDEALREKGFGDHEGKPVPQIGSWAIGGASAEPITDFVKRVVNGLHKYLDDGVPLIVAHGGVRRAMMMAMGMDPRHDAQGNKVYLNALPLEFVRLDGWWSVRKVA